MKLRDDFHSEANTTANSFVVYAARLLGVFATRLANINDMICVNLMSIWKALIQKVFFIQDWHIPLSTFFLILETDRWSLDFVLTKRKYTVFDNNKSNNNKNIPTVELIVILYIIVNLL